MYKFQYLLSYNKIIEVQIFHSIIKLFSMPLKKVSADGCEGLHKTCVGHTADTPSASSRCGSGWVGYF